MYICEMSFYYFLYDHLRNTWSRKIEPAWRGKKPHQEKEKFNINLDI